MTDRYHPYDWTAVKTELFFLLTGVDVVGVEATDQETVSTCRYNGMEFQLESWQIQSWINSQLAWLDDEKQTLLLFPYKHLLYIYRWQWHWPFLTKEYFCPSELLQDYTWMEYRHLQDYMEMYIRINNQIVQARDKAMDKKQLLSLNKQLTDAKNEFLTVLFGGERPDAGGSPRMTMKEIEIAGKVTEINDVQWQVILLWWSGFMKYLQQQYPRCFKSSGDGKKKKRQPNPLELYVSITATMQKYVGLDEEKVNHQTFHIILEQLERIGKENEEMERINKKHKK